MKAPKLVKTKKSQLKVPVRTAGRKMQFFRNSNKRACGASFSHAQTLKNHIHKGQKQNFKCASCDKSFIEGAYLKKTIFSSFMKGTKIINVMIVKNHLLNLVV